MDAAKRLLFCFVCIAAAVTAGGGKQTTDAVLGHLDQMISWYRDLGAIERAAAAGNEAWLRESVRRISTEALQLGFDFARAAVALADDDPAPAATPDTGRRRMENAAARVAQRVAAIQARIKDLDAALAKASPAARATLAARRKQAAAELDLAEQVQKSVKTLSAFMGAAASGTGAFAARIDQLERTVPEAMRAAAQRPAHSAGQGAEAAEAFHPDSAGVFGLAAELYSVARTRSRLKHVIEETDTLVNNIVQLRTPLGTELRNSIRRSDAIAATPAPDDPALIAASNREVEALSARFKELSAALIPLREEGILIETTRGNLIEWRNALDARSSSVAGYLVLRGATLAIAIGILLFISEMWRRMTFRYVRDARRRRQFLVLRRIVVGSAVALVLVLGFVSEVGSLATYAGFLTAGIAVALQNPIVSVVGYFFLIGRYGLRVGDRVTISGVTGDVIEIGLVRIHVMELAGTGANLRPTGRVVGFANSVLFQPAALFKQMPGTDYVWHTAAVTLAPESDARRAEARLTAAFDAVYAEYRESIERQHEQFERAVDMKLAPPQPQTTVRATEAGVEFSVRYPVEPRLASSIDERVLRALQDAVAEEPGLALARAGDAKIQHAI